MSSLGRPEFEDLRPYEEKNVSYPIKLDANESPFDFPGSLKALVFEEFSWVTFNRYPGRAAAEFKEALAGRLGVSREMVAIGNGSNDLIQALMLAFVGPGRKVILPRPSYSMYKQISRVVGMEIVEVPLLPSFELDCEAILDAARDMRGVIFISNPNNPTGNCFKESSIERVLEGTGCVVVVDEAYYEFSGKSCVGRLACGMKSGSREAERLVILRTFSKAFGLAGLRLGYCIGSPEVMEDLAKVRLPYGMNEFTPIIGKVGLKNWSLFEEGIRLILSERERVYQGLSAIEGIYPFPSESNFILFRTAAPARLIYEGLLDIGVAVRDFSKDPILGNCLRVTIGRKEENDRFLECLGRVLDKVT